MSIFVYADESGVFDQAHEKVGVTGRKVWHRSGVSWGLCASGPAFSGVEAGVGAVGVVVVCGPVWPGLLFVCCGDDRVGLPGVFVPFGEHCGGVDGVLVVGEEPVNCGDLASRVPACMGAQ